jgi:heptosyltransferase-2
MNINSEHNVAMEDLADTRPILIVPYMWIGDFVRGHSVVRVLKQRWPNRPVDLLVTSLCAPLVDYMPGVRAGIVWDLPRGRLAVAKQWRLAAQLRARNYGTALVLPRTWKSAIAPALAGIPERVGFVGEARFGLINKWRWGEKALPRFIDKNAALALPDGDVIDVRGFLGTDRPSIERLPSPHYRGTDPSCRGSARTVQPVVVSGA